MIRYKLKALIAQKEIEWGRRITIDEVSRETGVNRTTISKLANNRPYNTSMEVVDALLNFFDVSIDELVEHQKD